MSAVGLHSATLPVVGTSPSGSSSSSPSLLQSLANAVHKSLQSGSSASANQSSSAPSTAAGTELDNDPDDNKVWAALIHGSPLQWTQAVATGVAAAITGTYDPRYGNALIHMTLAGERIVTSSLRAMGNPHTIIGEGTKFISRVLPLINLGYGAYKVYEGWKELPASMQGDPTNLIHSKEARTGLIQLAAGTLLFVPGVGAAIAGALLQFTSAANDLDEFHALDATGIGNARVPLTTIAANTSANLPNLKARLTPGDGAPNTPLPGPNTPGIRVTGPPAAGVSMGATVPTGGGPSAGQANLVSEWFAQNIARNSD